MTALDILVLLLIGGGAVFGFLRGFVHEALSLVAWIVAVVAIRFFHTPLAAWLLEPLGSESGAAALALVLLFGVTYGLAKWAAHALGKRTRQSVLGPIDRFLGFGFGALKGLVMATLIFLLVTLVSDTIWPGQPRPEWVRQARSYTLLSASGDALVDFVETRRTDTPDAAEPAAPADAAQ